MLMSPNPAIVTINYDQVIVFLNLYKLNLMILLVNVERIFGGGNSVSLLNDKFSLINLVMSLR
jgi:hypothetical protein